MTRETGRYAIVIGTFALLACGSPPQVPTPVRGPQASAPVTPAPPPPVPDPGAYPLAGSYAVTLDIGTGCPVVPEAERSRKYSATIGYSGGGRYVVTLNDATFLTGAICTAGSAHFAGIGCHQFFASEDTDTALFFLENNNDEAHGGHIVERMSSGTWLEIIGNVQGKFNGSSIEATGAGSVWYCPTPLGYPFPCQGSVGCHSDDMRLTLERK